MLFGWGGDKNVIHMASMPRTLVFIVFWPLCTTHCAKDVKQDKLSMSLATMPKALACAVFFASLRNILHKDVEQGKLSQASMPLATMPKTLVFLQRYCFSTACGFRIPG